MAACGITDVCGVCGPYHYYLALSLEEVQVVVALYHGVSSTTSRRCTGLCLGMCKSKCLCSGCSYSVFSPCEESELVRHKIPPIALGDTFPLSIVASSAVVSVPTKSPVELVPFTGQKLVCHPQLQECGIIRKECG